MWIRVLILSFRMPETHIIFSAPPSYWSFWSPRRPQAFNLSLLLYPCGAVSPLLPINAQFDPVALLINQSQYLNSTVFNLSTSNCPIYCVISFIHMISSSIWYHVIQLMLYGKNPHHPSGSNILRDNWRKRNHVEPQIIQTEACWVELDIHQDLILRPTSLSPIDATYRLYQTLKSIKRYQKDNGHL